MNGKAKLDQLEFSDLKGEEINPVYDDNKIKIKKGTFFFLLLLIIIIFVGSIFATYFGKSCNQKESEKIEMCKDMVCKNPLLNYEWATSCPTDPPTTIKTTTRLEYSTDLLQTTNDLTIVSGETTTTTTAQTTTRGTTPTVTITSTQTTKAGGLINSYRLPENLKPYFYDMTIKPYVGTNETYKEKAFTFEGKTLISFTCLQATNKIVLHTKELKITSSKLSTNSDSITITAPPTIDNVTDFTTFTLSKNCVAKSNYTIEIEFSGVILQALYGFYRSSYSTSENKTYYLATTKFEPHYARRAFPCFDEPAMKAEFVIRIVRPKSLKSVSNNPLDKTTPYPDDADWEVDNYEKTVFMSTYLVAYVISNFETIPDVSQPNGIDVEVSARPEAIQNGEGDYALLQTKEIIEFFNGYFGVKYPLKKITQISIPDFNSGAMENWGLITYRETSLLYNRTTDTIANKRRVSKTISHELAHQWFGNLVTMKWWNDLWLNEGFASWVEFLGYNSTNPEWRDLDNFFVAKISVLVKDSYELSHPISVEVINPNDIPSIFDSISYDKGASILRMITAFLGEKTFKAGVSNYLKNNAYKNAEQDDLWAALTDQAHIDGTLDRSFTVKDIMDTWTLKKGYPVVQIDRTRGNEIAISQKWFLVNPLNTVQKNLTEYNKYKWFVPFTFTTKNIRNFNFESKPTWLKPNDTEIKITLPAGTTLSSWVIGNLKHAGFYRVNYDQDGWDLLIEQLSADHTLIDSTSRAQLIDDSFNLGRGEMIPQTKFFDVTKYLDKEQDPIVFAASFSSFEYVSDMLSSDFNAFRLYKKFYTNLLKPTYDRLDWKNDTEDANDINLQLSAIDILCSNGYKPCIEKSREFYNDWINNNKEIPSNFKNIVYQTVMKYGDEETWLKLYEKSIAEKNNPEKLRMIKALTVTTNYNLLKFLLTKVFDSTFIRTQDCTSIINDISSNSVGRRLAFDFIDEKWDVLLKEFGGISFTLPTVVTRVFSKLNTQFDLTKMRDFKVSHPNLGIANNVYNEALETVESNVRWMETNLKSITDFLANLPKDRMNIDLIE